MNGRSGASIPRSIQPNPSSRGVIFVDGTVGISGTLRGRVTLYSTANVALPLIAVPPSCFVHESSRSTRRSPSSS